MVIWSIVPLLFHIACSSLLERPNFRNANASSNIAFIELETEFLEACKGNKLNTIKRMLKNPLFDPSIKEYEGIKTCIKSKYAEMTNLLVDSVQLVEDQAKSLLNFACGKFGSSYATHKILSKIGFNIKADILQEALKVASAFGTVDVVKILLRNGSHFVSDPIGLVLIACKNKNFETAKFLLDQFGLQSIASEQLKNHLLIFGCESGNLDFIKWLVESYPIADVEGSLLVACKTKSTDVLRFLLDHPSTKHLSNKSCYCLFIEACAHSNIDMVQLLQDRFGLEKCTTQSTDAFELLETIITVTASGSLTADEAFEITRYLLQLPIEWPDTSIHVALRHACFRGSLALVHLLVEYRPIFPLNLVVIDGPYISSNPLKCACMSGNLEVFQFILEQLAVNPVEIEEIIMAIEGGSLEILKILVQRAALNGLNQQIDLHRALLRAVLRSNYEMVSFLLDQPRVNPSHQNGEIFINACAKGNTAIVERFLQYYPQVNLDVDGNKAICEAANYGHLAVMHILLKYPEVDAGTLDNTPLRNAVKKKHFKVVEFLLRHHKVDPSANRFQSVKYADGDILKLLLKDKRVEPFLTKCFPGPLADLCKTNMNRLVAFLSHPAVDYRLAYMVNTLYSKGLVRNFQPYQFEACVTGNLEVVKIIDFSEISSLLLDILIHRFKDCQSLREIFFEGRIKQLDFLLGLESHQHLRDFIWDHLDLNMTEMKTALCQYFRFKSLFYTNAAVLNMDCLMYAGKFAEFSEEIMNYACFPPKSSKEKYSSN